MLRPHHEPSGTIGRERPRRVCRVSGKLTETSDSESWELLLDLTLSPWRSIIQTLLHSRSSVGNFKRSLLRAVYYTVLATPPLLQADHQCIRCFRATCAISSGGFAGLVPLACTRMMMKRPHFMPVCGPCVSLEGESRSGLLVIVEAFPRRLDGKGIYLSLVQYITQLGHVRPFRH